MLKHVVSGTKGMCGGVASHERHWNLCVCLASWHRGQTYSPYLSRLSNRQRSYTVRLSDKDLYRPQQAKRVVENQDSRIV